MVLRNVVRVMFHVAPLVPLIWNEGVLSIILTLFLAMCYIKTKKLGAGLEQKVDLAAMPTENRKFMESLFRARRFWSYPTFLN